MAGRYEPTVQKTNALSPMPQGYTSGKGTRKTKVDKLREICGNRAA